MQGHNPNQPFPPQPGQPPAPWGQPAAPAPGTMAPPNPYAQQPGQPPNPYAQQPAPAAAAPPPTQGRAALAVPDLNDAEAGNSSGNYLPLGSYVIDVTDLRLHQGFNGLSSILEFDVVESDNGTRGHYSWAKRFDSQQDKTRGMQRNEIKGFLCQLIDHLRPGTNASQRWTERSQPGAPTLGDQFAAYCYQSPSPAVGTRWFVNVWHKPPGRNSAPGATGVSKHNWEPMQPGETRGLGPQAQPQAQPGAPWA